jgi:hypothetical protein
MNNLLIAANIRAALIRGNDTSLIEPRAPLLTSLIPSGMSDICKKPAAPRISIRKAVR